MYYSLVLIPMGAIPAMIHLSGWIGAICCMLAAILYFAASVVFYRNNDQKSARRVMFASFIYLPIILLALLIDKF
jgi:protoheme IX farnesyltransferase